MHGEEWKGNIMTIDDARRWEIPARDILAYDMSDEEKAVYIFENNKEEIRKKFPDLYYCLLAIANKYARVNPSYYFNSGNDDEHT